MKKLFTFFSLLLAVSLAGCKKTSVTPVDSETPKLISSVSYSDVSYANGNVSIDDGIIYTYTLSYDKDGRIEELRYTRSDTSEEYYTIRVTYGENEIGITNEDVYVYYPDETQTGGTTFKDVTTSEISLDDNGIAKSGSYESIEYVNGAITPLSSRSNLAWSIEYDSSGHLKNKSGEGEISEIATIKVSTSETYDFTWNGDNLTGIKETYTEDDYEEVSEASFTYGSHTNREDVFPDLNWILTDDDHLVSDAFYPAPTAMMGVYGKLSPKLIAEMDSRYKYTFDYEFDKDGYVTKVTRTHYFISDTYYEVRTYNIAYKN